MLVFLLVLSWTRLLLGAPQEALVTSLPGFNGNFASKHYSGYITIDESHGRALFYYLVTSESNPASDPLLLWLNGGPGCSSFDGFAYENGPFTFYPVEDGMPTLTRNSFTWAKIANVLYLDSPAGVGLSYSNNTDDYKTGDTKTALDSYAFLLKWFEAYPEFQKNDFYITGESYAGVYIPNLSKLIADGIDAGVHPAVNFKGYMIGNGCTDVEFDGNALVPFVHGMGLISTELYKEVTEACSGKFWNVTEVQCSSKLGEVRNDISSLNVYDILEPCYHNPEAWNERTDVKLPKSFRALGETQREGLPVRKRMFGRAWPLGLTRRDGYFAGWRELGGPPHLKCLDTTVAATWLNRPEVRQALHAKPIDEIGEFTICSDLLNYTAEPRRMIPIHKKLTSKGYRVHIYSGDHDMCVPFTGSEAWTSSLGYKKVRSWQAWYVGGQVAGYTVAYEKGLTFTTVKGAGHSVPEYKPREALAMVERWLAGVPL